MLCLRISPTLRLLLMSKKLIGACTTPNYTTCDIVEFPNEILQQQRSQVRNHFTTDFNLNYFTNKEDIKDVTNMTVEEIDETIKQLMKKNQTKHLMKIMSNCFEQHKVISDNVAKDLFRYLSVSGNTDSVIMLQNYCSKLNPCLFKRNGEFLHYLAKAQCIKGNSEKGLSILKSAYEKYDNLRGFYRIIFRELIQDSILNKSEASVVIFKKYVLLFSEQWNDHYPLICFWHICWSSNWFSDQVLSNDLLEISPVLRDIVKERSSTLCINILKEYNDDAVVRMLQTLLKYNMMQEYAKVLQILFAYKLKNKDLKGCTEIVKNCEVLGISLPSYQQGSYIKMLIDGSPSNEPTKTKNFKLKF